MKHLSLIASVLRKDWQIFWPLTALTAVLIIVQSTFADPESWSVLITLLESASWLACAFLILSLIHEDAIVSSQHDWLIRPLPGLDVLAAKVIFVVVGVIVPLILGRLVMGLRLGYPIGETMLAGIGIGPDVILLVLLAVALGAITANMRQAALVFVAACAGVALGLNAIARFSSVTQDLGMSGVEWIVKNGIETLGFVLCVAIFWLQYARRKTALSYKLVIAASIVVFGTFLLPWSSFFAVQKALSQDQSIADALQIEITQGCFTNKSFGANAQEPMVQNGADSATQIPTSFTMDEGKVIGPNAIAFITTLAQPKLPPDTRLLVSHVGATYLDGANTQLKLRPAQPYPDRRRDIESMRLYRNYWLLSRAQYEQLAANPRTQLQLDYSLSLLGEERSIEIATDGQRKRYEGLGYCGATFDRARGEVAVNCLVPSEQPALLVAEVVGESEYSMGRSRFPDYVPSALDLRGSQRHYIRLPTRSAIAPRVKITAYEARAHFDRRVLVPGILGGSGNNCPAPPVK